jgi:hypothetical protein
MTAELAAKLPTPAGSVLRHDGRRYYVDFVTPLADPWPLLAHACKMAANGRVSPEFVLDLKQLIDEEVGA